MTARQGKKERPVVFKDGKRVGTLISLVRQPDGGMVMTYRDETGEMQQIIERAS